MPSLSLRGIEKTLGKTPVLRGIDLEVPDGALCVLVGPSGCGKSTLLRAIAGLEQPDVGTIRIGDRDVTALPPRDRDVAMVFQSYALYPHLTVRENLSFGLSLRGEKKEVIAERIATVSARLGLDLLLERLPKQLSGGQRQRVAMGRAIARRPALFLFDEPLSNLDAALRGDVRVEIRKLHDELAATMVYVTHDQVEAMTLADILVVLNKGRVEQCGAPLDVYRAPSSRFVAGFLGTPPMSFVRGRLEGEAVVSEGIRIPLTKLSPSRRNESRVDGEVLVGVRAQDVRVGKEIELKVEVVEALGTESFAHGKVGEARFVARLDAGEEVKAGDTLSLDVVEGGLHLFDPKTERAL